jgi:hypothetical protein
VLKPFNYAKCASENFVRMMHMINKNCQNMPQVSFFFMEIISPLFENNNVLLSLVDTKFLPAQALPSNHFPDYHN